MTGVHMKRGKFRHTQRAPRDDGSREGSDASTSEGTPRLADTHEKPGERQGRVLLRAFRENVALLTP